MVNKTIRAVLALAVSVLCATSVFAQNYQAFVDTDIITTPSELANAVEDSLTYDPNGDDMTPDGLNTTPNELLRALQVAGGNVSVVERVPNYLRSLVSRPMDSRKEYHLARASVADGMIDTTVGLSRSPRGNEYGWHDPDTGDFIMAGDCGNTYIPDQKPVVVEYTREPIKPRGCDLGRENMRWITMIMFEPKVADYDCSQQYMYDQHGDKFRDSDPVERHGNDTSFSNDCGIDFHKEVLAGNLELGSITHDVRIGIEQGDEKIIFFEGTLTGQSFESDSAQYSNLISRDGLAVMIPDDFNSGDVVVYFADQSKVRTPTPTGVGDDISIFRRGCMVKPFFGIDAWPLS